MPRGDVRKLVLPATKGIRADLPKHLVPDDYLASGENVLMRDGRIITRPGMRALTTAAPSANRVMGGLFYTDHTQTNRVIIGTQAGFHLYDGSSWSGIDGTGLTGGTSNQVRFAVFPFANSTRVIAVNDKDAPQTYTGSGNFSALAGSPPIARDVTVAFQRVVLLNVTVGGTRRGSAMWISGFQDPTIWSANQEVNLTDTKDTIVGGRALNDQVFAVYKDRSQWIGIGADFLFPFQFQLKDQQWGPVSPASIVQAEGLHYYIGQDGDVYRFDGNRCQSVGGAVKRLIQADLDWSNQGQTHGVYDPINREIWWFWPSYRVLNGFSGVVFHIPSFGLTYVEYSAGAFSPLMTYGLNISASFEWRDTSGGDTWNGLTGTWDALANTYPTWNSFSNASQLGFLVGDTTGQVHKFGRAGGDNGLPFDAYWDTPFRAYTGDGENNRVDVIESFFKQTSPGVDVDIILVKTDNLGDDGTSVTAQTVDTSSGGKLRASYEDQQARFISVRHRILGTYGLDEYKGSVLYLYKRGEA